MKAEPSRLIPQKLAANLQLLIALQDVLLWVFIHASFQQTNLQKTRTYLQSHRHGGSGGLSPPNKHPSHPKLKYETLYAVEFLSYFRMSRPLAQT